MNKEKLIIISIILWTSILIISLLLIGSAYSINQELKAHSETLSYLGIEKVTNEFTEFQKDKIKILPPTDEEIIFSIANDVSNEYNYQLDVFDCTDFSRELKNRLIAKGYDAYCVFGLRFDEGIPRSIHTWVEVNQTGNLIWIEAVTGSRVDWVYNELYKNYKSTEGLYLLKYRGKCI